MFQALAQRTGLDLASLMQLEPAPPAPRSRTTTTPHRRTPANPSRNRGGARRRAPAPRVIPTWPRRPSPCCCTSRTSPAWSDPAPLAELEGEDVGLLRELLTLLQRRPESNTAMLLGHWYGTPEGELLSRLAGQERLIPKSRHRTAVCRHHGRVGQGAPPIETGSASRQTQTHQLR